MTEALYAKVYEALRARITDGVWSEGDRLPSQESLGAEFAVSPITVNRALDLLRDDGYVTRRPRIGTVVASRASTQRERAASLPLIAYVLPGFDDAFGTWLLNGLLHSATKRARVVVTNSRGDTRLEEDLIEEQIEHGIDGLILQPSSSRFIPPAVATLIGRRFPIVIVDRTLPGTPVSTVTSDNVNGGRLAAEHLFELGHTQLALVTSANPVSTLDARRRGVVDAHAARHVRLAPEHVLTEVGPIVPGSPVASGGDIERIATFLNDHPEVTGCVTSEYGIALVVLHAAKRAGRSIPEDLSVVSFDAPAGFDEAAVPLTHIEQDQHTIGGRAFTLLQQQLQEPGSVAQETVPVRLVKGASSGPAPS